jgi:hypothetical protein
VKHQAPNSDQANDTPFFAVVGALALSDEVLSSLAELLIESVEAHGGNVTKVDIGGMGERDGT